MSNRGEILELVQRAVNLLEAEGSSELASRSAEKARALELLRDALKKNGVMLLEHRQNADAEQINNRFAMAAELLERHGRRLAVIERDLLEIRTITGNLGSDLAAAEQAQHSLGNRISAALLRLELEHEKRFAELEQRIRGEELAAWTVGDTHREEINLLGDLETLANAEWYEHDKDSAHAAAATIIERLVKKLREIKLEQLRPSADLAEGEHRSSSCPSNDAPVVPAPSEGQRPDRGAGSQSCDGGNAG